MIIDRIRIVEMLDPSTIDWRIIIIMDITRDTEADIEGEIKV